MEFVLNEYHRNISDEELINDVLRVAKLCDTCGLSMTKYNELGKYHSSTIIKRFGGWYNALESMGLSAYKYDRTNQKNSENRNDEDFFKDVNNVASNLHKTFITTGEYKKFGQYNLSWRIKRYGSWNKIIEKAGLSPTPFRLGKGKEILDEELFQDIERVWIKLGRQPTMTDVKNGEFSFGQNTFTRRFGGWRGTLEAFVKYINSEDEQKPINDIIEGESYIETSASKKESKTINTHKSYHKTSRDINLRLRFKVMQRDNFKCCICGKSPATSPHVTLHIDHIKPWSKGGETTIDNLQTLCSECNLGKSDLYNEDQESIEDL